MKILVCGGRKFFDEQFIFTKLDELRKEIDIKSVIQGGASGVDRCAEAWAIARGIPNKTYHADWKKYGNSAGPIRNRRMLYDGKPDLIVAFPGGKGTADMIKAAKNYGAEIKEYHP